MNTDYLELYNDLKRTVTQLLFFMLRPNIVHIMRYALTGLQKALVENIGCRAEPERVHIKKTELSPAVGQTCGVQDKACTSKLAEGTTLSQLEQGERLFFTLSHSHSKTALSSNMLFSTLGKYKLHPI